ncbi:orotidine 5'-phosphate decarboxylase / HUMPS family protein, partial [Klebsiella pneumoniae]
MFLKGTLSCHYRTPTGRPRYQTLASAYETTRLIAEEVDIIEVGTILCVGEGVRAVRDLKALYPHKIVLADAKIADAG